MLNRFWHIVLFYLILYGASPVSLGSKSLNAGSNQIPPVSDKSKILLPEIGYHNMVKIQKGMFRMGSSFQQTLKYYNQCKKLDKRCKVWWFRDERPEHSVYLDTFWMDRYEVTNEKYLQFVLATGHRPALDDSCKSKTCKAGNLW